MDRSIDNMYKKHVSGFLTLELIISVALSVILIMVIFKSVNVVKNLFKYDKQALINIWNINPTPVTFDITDIKGRIDSCNPTLNNLLKQSINFDVKVYKISTESRNIPTSIITRNGYAFVTLDSSTSSDPDLMILDIKNLPQSGGDLSVVSTINNGPGFLSQRLVDNTLYIGNSSIANQLFAYDILNKNQPQLISSLKLSGVLDQQTVGFNLAFHRNQIILGTKKTDAAEIRLISVDQNHTLVERGQYEVDSQINDVILNNQQIYISTPKDEELEKLIIATSTGNISKQSGFNAPRGNGNGKSLELSRGTLYLGRTVGDKELYVVSDGADLHASSSLALGSSIDDEMLLGNWLALITPKNNGTLYLINTKDGLSIFKEIVIGGNGRPFALACDGISMYALTDQGYVWVIKPIAHE